MTATAMAHGCFSIRPRSCLHNKRSQHARRMRHSTSTSTLTTCGTYRPVFTNTVTNNTQHEFVYVWLICQSQLRHNKRRRSKPGQPSDESVVTQRLVRTKPPSTQLGPQREWTCVDWSGRDRTRKRRRICVSRVRTWPTTATSTTNQPQPTN